MNDVSKKPILRCIFAQFLVVVWSFETFSRGYTVYSCVSLYPCYVTSGFLLLLLKATRPHEQLLARHDGGPCLLSQPAL